MTTMREPVTLVVHGHFYQPPRENPWTEEVAREPSAAPFHDWNARIAAESYRPNAFARIVDEQGRVLAMVDNYERMSFDMGPTLLSWVERHQPDVYGRMVAADAASGGGMAQGFGHVILPLCNARDLRTQVRWGLADFRHRFGRTAEGMWLPEAAVNDDVLAVLAEAGVQFTLLAPGQASRVRPLAGGPWIDVTDGSIDPSRPYRWRHPDDPDSGVDIVFYDGALSHDIAFGLATLSSEELISRTLAAAEHRSGPLVTVAADGETFGHHHRFGDRVLAYALAVEAPRREVEVGNLAVHLRDHRPEHEVEVKESAWSCAHGVGRWREDCGCSTGGQPGWNQRWRGPLRKALDLLRDHAASVFEHRGNRIFAGDVWVVRDAYIDVLLGRVAQEDFVREHIDGDPVEAFTLLEIQRHAMAMYTSCGWFFNDLAGLETVQVLRYAARVMDLLMELGEDSCEEPFLEILAKAESNVAANGNGRQIWTEQVLPARVDSSRVVAHLALGQLLEDLAPPAQLGGFGITVLDNQNTRRGGFGLCSGHVRLTHLRTGHARERVFAAVRLGGLEVFGVSRPADPRRDASTLSFLREAFAKGAPLVTLLRMISDNFGSREFGLGSALPDGADRILASTANHLSDRFGALFEQLFEDNRPTLEKLAASGDPLPAILRAPAELALARQLEAAVAAQAGSSDPEAYRDAVAIARTARDSGFAIETPQARATIERLLLDAVHRAPEDEGAATEALAIVELAAALDIRPDVEPAQEIVYEALMSGAAQHLRRLGAALGLAVDELGLPTP